MKITSEMAIAAHLAGPVEYTSEFGVDDTRKMLEAAIAAAEQPVAVKTLRWRKSGNQNGHQWQGQGAMGFLAYISDVGPDGDREGFYSQLGQFDTLEQAQAAAQQDFEARIRSALASPAQPAPPQDNGADRQIERLAVLRKLGDDHGGENEKAPDQASVDAAIAFVRRWGLPDNAITTLSDDGFAVIELHGDSYADITFRPARASAAEPVDAALIGVAETVKESGGGWQPCSGCYDTEDGHPTQKYDYSQALKTDVGCGCHECGGLGATWEYYSEADVASMLEEGEDYAICCGICEPPCVAAPASAVEAVIYESPITGWQSMDCAPKEGKHVILAVKEGAFIYSVQGAFHEGQWNAVHRNNVDPLAWMPNIRLPDSFTIDIQ